VGSEIFKSGDKVYKFRLCIEDDKKNILVEIVTSDYQNSWIGWTEYKCTISNLEKCTVTNKFQYFWKKVGPLVICLVIKVVESYKAIKNWSKCTLLYVK